MTAGAQYRQYLEQHIDNVSKAWRECLKPNITNQYIIPDMEYIIRIHDRSKYNGDEFEAYAQYFYGKTPPSEKTIKKFNTAWLLHQNKNPHHWQHWVLINDDGTIEAQDMPLIYVLEMLCDWHSFRYVDNSISTQQWYEQHRDKMILSPNTIKLIEQYLPYMTTQENK